MYNFLLESIQTLNQLLTAGIAITAFSLLLYALTFNLRDRVARSFAMILLCVVVVFVGDAIGSTAATAKELQAWLKLEWVGIVFLPPAYLHFSDALLVTTGRPSRGRRRLAVRLTYLISFLFLLALPFGWLVGPLLENAQPAPHLQRTWLTWVFTLYYAVSMIWSWINFWRANRRTETSTSRRRMHYLLAGALAPALGSYPYLLFGSGIAATYPLLFWLTAVLSNVFVFFLLVVMAYSVAFFGVPWPDRVVKRRLAKWLMRGPVTAIVVLAITTLVRRSGERIGIYTAEVVPVLMVATILVMEYAITLLAPLWERWLFHGGDSADLQLLQTLEERLLTSGDIRQFLEAIVAAVCDRLQLSKAFIVSLSTSGLEMIVSIGEGVSLDEALSQDLARAMTVDRGEDEEEMFLCGNYFLVPLFGQRNGDRGLMGFMGVIRQTEQVLDDDQRDALQLLAHRAALALEDRYRQQKVFSSLQALTPQIDLIQRLRAASRYDGTAVLTTPEEPLEYSDLARWVKDALTHYWGGPKLTESPLLQFMVVRQALADHDDNPANALRTILRKAIEQVRPDGERRFTGEWILYNILEMKFMEGHKVREIAQRLAMSEADLYRKQRVAIEAVASAILEMEQKVDSEGINGDPTK